MVLILEMKQINRNNLDLAIILLAILAFSFYFLGSRKVILDDTIIPVQNHWLDSVNVFLSTGKILMAPDVDRVSAHLADTNLVWQDPVSSRKYVPVEEVAGNDDQGYAFILSILNYALQNDQVTYLSFIKFNFLYFVIFGSIVTVLIYLSFRSVFLSIFFLYLYLFVNGIYGGAVDNHWMIGPLSLFYLFFIVFFLTNRKKFRIIFFSYYFSVAGWANVIREGDGTIGLLLFLLLVVLLVLCEGFSKTVKTFGLSVAALVIVIYILPTLLLAGIRMSRDSIYFGGKHSALAPRHLLWHHAFIGLGYVPNKYGIRYDEYNHQIFLSKIAPQVRLYSYEEDRLLRGLYFGYIREAPSLFFDNLRAKLSTINELVGRWLWQASPFKFITSTIYGFLAYSSFLLTIVISRNDRIRLTIAILILGFFAISLLPPLIVVPMFFYLYAMQAAVFLSVFYLFSLIFLKLKSKRKNFFRKFIILG